LKDVPHPRAFGVIMLNQDSQILLFLEKPIPQELGLATLTFSKKETIKLQSNLVNTGIYAFKHDVLDILESLHDLMDFGKEVFPYLAREYGIFGYARRENYYWMDAGNPQTYLYTNWDVLRRWAFPYFPRASQEDGNIWINDNWPSFPSSSKIEAPSAFGREITIGKNTQINAKTVIGDNVIIGNNCQISASVVWNNVIIEDNVTMKNTIICNEAHIPAKSELAKGTVIGPHYSSSNTIKTTPNQTLKLEKD
jgi:NDP-sugar pyrophosphorylase family protein